MVIYRTHLYSVHYDYKINFEQLLMIITIIGGGHLGHVCAGFLSSQQDVEVRLLTRRPDDWNKTLEITDPDGNVLHGSPSMITASYSEALKDADIALLCLPGFSIREMLTNIAPYLDKKSAVGSVVSNTGFFFQAFDILGKDQPLFGFQRAPFISRIKEYGKSASLLGYKPSLSVAIEQTKDKENLRNILERIFQCTVNLLESFYEASLSNSNPLLHTSRLYTLWKDYEEGETTRNIPFFYREWTLEASELYIAMDNELQSLLSKLGIRKGAIPDVLTYYESTDAHSLTRKLSSIAAFRNIPSPMVKVGNGYEPDFTSRYFTEDFAFGLRFARDLCHKEGVECPNMDRVFEWGSMRLSKNHGSFG